MFAEPQTITINAIANALPRIGSAPNSGTFSNPERTVRLSLQHGNAKVGRNRSSVRLDFSKIAADPLTAENAEFKTFCYMVVDSPLRGLSTVEVKQVVDGLTAWLTATSGSNVTKMLGGES